MNNINAIIFDFGGVILDIDFDRCADSFEKLGVKDFKKMYSKKNADPVFQKLEEGKISQAEFYRQFRRLTGITVTDREIKNAWNSLLLSYRIKALETLVSIKSKYQLFLLSNTNILHQEKFTEIYRKEINKGNFEDHFHKVYYSHEIGSRKPDTKAYDYVLKQNNLDPSMVLFIDDSIQNIDPAKELGMKAIHLEDKMRIEDLGLSQLTD